MKIGDVLRRWRLLSDLTLQKASREIGIPIPTLSRIEHGEKMDGETLAKVLVWLLGAT